MANDGTAVYDYVDVDADVDGTSYDGSWLVEVSCFLYDTVLAGRLT